MFFIKETAKPTPISQQPDTNPASVPALSVKGLSKVYANGVVALKDVSLDIRQKDFFALLGENGAGKTTLLGIVCSLVNKSKGEVKIFGDDLITQTSRAKSHIGLVPQEFNFNIFQKVRNIVYQQGGYYGMPLNEIKARGEKYLRKLDLWDKRDEQSNTLSGGMKRRLMIARALIHEPRLLILDEPTAGVDIEIRHSMWDFLQELNKNGKTIILTTHYLEEAEQLCRNVAIIHEGRIIANNSMQSLLRQLGERTYIIETNNILPAQVRGDFYEGRRLDDNTLEVRLDKQYGLNKLFRDLDHKKLDIANVDIKDNRLESAFLELTK